MSGKRGFAAMSPEVHREIASLGGHAVQASGKAHRFTAEDARVAGSKGGRIVAARPGHMSTIGRKGGAAISRDLAHMSRIGKKGGELVAARHGHMSAIGKKGGDIVSKDLAHMSAIGKIGKKGLVAASDGLSGDRVAAMSLGNLRDKLIDFHGATNVPILSTPTVPADARVRLRARLIVEECFEFLEACFGCSFMAQRYDVELKISDANVRVDMPEAADALADIAYVVEGANLEFGINSGPVLDEVHAANMRKTTGPIREDGKRLKPPGWIGPDIVAVLERQRT